MNFFHSKLMKWIWFGIGFLIFLLIVWVGLMEFATRTLKMRQDEIQTVIKTQMGSPITLESLDVHWQGLNISISLHDVKILDPKLPVPYISIQKLDLSTNIFRFFFNSSMMFDELSFTGPKVIMGWDAKHELSAVGLNGEWLPSSIDWQALLKAFTTQKLITIKQGMILWRGPGSLITQKIDGKFSWKDRKAISWIFKGKQQISVNNGAFTPRSPINLQMDPNQKKLTLQGELANVSLDCAATFPNNTEKPYLNCRAKARELNLGMIHQHLVLKEQDPEWLRWLVRSIEDGILTTGKVQVSGPFEELDWQGEINFRDLELQYAEDWPKINTATGLVSLEKEKINVNLWKGKISETPIKMVKALIAPLGTNQQSHVQVEGILKGRLEKGLEFLRSSPLKESVASHLTQINPTGPMDLHLQLKIPLGLPKKPAEVQGELIVKDGLFTIHPLELPISNVNGNFHFTDKGVTARDVNAILLGRNIQIEMTPENIKATTLVDVQTLEEKFKTQLSQYLQGQSEMSFTYLPKTNIWQIESNLIGMQIALPEPFGKKTNQKQAMKMIIYETENEEQRVALAFKDLFDSKWVLNRTRDAMNIRRAHIAVGAIKQADWVATPGIHINFERLNINSGEQKLPINQLLKTVISSPITFYTKNLIIDDKLLGEVDFHLQPIATGYEITEASIKTPHAMMKATGQWRLGDGQSATSLNGEIMSQNVGQALAVWGYSSIKESNGNIQFRLQWPESPFQFDLKNAQGSAEIQLKSGRILGVNPGLGRILGLLSVENLFRRGLKGEFNDVFKKGFAFDTLDAKIKFQKGMASIDSLAVEGSAARIGINGSANLKTKGIDLQMMVIPKVGSTLPLAASLAFGNPALGAGIWFFDKISGSRITEITQHNYHVTGTWDAPHLQQRSTTKGKAR